MRFGIFGVAFVLAMATAARADCVSRSNYGGGIVFATDREPLGDGRVFGGERARDNDAPSSLTTGTLTAPTPAGTRGCTSRLSFFQALNHRFERGAGRRLLVYVHGYYTSFVTAARDALAIRRDLHFHGPIVLYSWPATVTAKPAYPMESRNAAWSNAHFDAFIHDLTSHFHGMPITFVARGVGARFAATGLRVVRDRRCRQCFGRAIFVEPEIARDDLTRRLREVALCRVRRDPHRAAAPITVYTAVRAPSPCSGVDTIVVAPQTIAATDGRDPVLSPFISSDVRGVFAGVSVRKRIHPATHATARRRRANDARS